MGRTARVETTISMRPISAVNPSVIACEATRTSSKTRHRHRAKHYLQWHSSEQIRVCVAVSICDRDAQNDNTTKQGDCYSDSVLPVPYQPLYLDKTFLCKLPEDRQSHFTQVWKVMENDITRQTDLFRICDRDTARVLTRNWDPVLHVTHPRINWKINVWIYLELCESQQYLGFHSSLAEM